MKMRYKEKIEMWLNMEKGDTIRSLLSTADHRKQLIHQTSNSK